MAAPYNPPVKNQDAVFFIALEDFANPGNFKANPTIAAGDFKVSKDGAALANLTTLPSVSPAGSVMVMISISSTEKNCDNLSLVCIDQTVPKEWADFFFNISTTAGQIDVNLKSINGVAITGTGVAGTDEWRPV